MKMQRFTTASFPILCSLVLALCPSIAWSAPQDVLILNFFARDNELLLFNRNSEPTNLDGWRFMTSNDTATGITTDQHGFEGIVLPPFSTFIIQLDNDADISHGLNAQDLGAIADHQSDAFAITLFFPDAKGEVSFLDETQIADHMQWSLNGNHHQSVEGHSQLAVDGGLWTEHDDWIDVREHTYLLDFIGDSTQRLHGPDDYDILILFCLIDMNHDGNTDFFDVSLFLTALAQEDLAADINHDGEFNFFDVSQFLNLFMSDDGCF